jgi:hypothetical protein
MSSDIVAQMRARAASARADAARALAREIAKRAKATELAARLAEGWLEPWKADLEEGRLYLIDRSLDPAVPKFYVGLSPSGLLEFRNMATGLVYYLLPDTEALVTPYRRTK